MKKLLALALCCAVLTGCGAASSQRTEASSTGADPGSAAISQASSADDGTADSVDAAPAVTRAPLTGAENTSGTAMRPVAVMVSNTPDAAVQWGLADADVVFEALTEGNTTNLCLWYSSIDTMPKTGPVAEGKDLFWQFALAENALLCQKGMNLYAENLLNCYSYQPVDALLVGVNSFDCDSGLPYGTRDELRWFTSGAAINNSLARYGISPAGSAAPLFGFGTADGGVAGAAYVQVMYSPTASTQLRYNAELDAWQLYNSADQPQLDANSGAQPAFQNVVLLNAATSIKDNKYTRDYNLTGGTGWYITGDTCRAISWTKGEPTAPLTLCAADGTPLAVNPGRTYVGITGIPGQSVTVLDGAGTPLALEAATTPAPAVTPDPAELPAPAVTPDPAAQSEAAPDPAAQPAG